MPIITVLDNDGNILSDTEVAVVDDLGTLVFQAYTDQFGNVDTGSLELRAYYILVGGTYYPWNGQNDITIIVEPPPPTPRSGTITGIRIRDNINQVWYNWDAPERRWYILVNQQKVYVNPACKPAANNLYVAFWAFASGAGSFTLKIVDASGRVLAEKTLTLANREGTMLEWTGEMPLMDYSFFCKIDP